MTAAAGPAVAVRRFDARSAVGSAGALLLGAALVGIAGVVGVAHTYDGSVPGIATGAAWVALLPAVLAAVLSGWRPIPGLAFTAGAGVLAIARFIADLPVLTAPNSAIRPELFYEVSTRAQPFTRAAGGVVLLAGDLVMAAAGLWAARRLAGSVSYSGERIFDAEPVAPAASSGGPLLLAEALDSADPSQAGTVRSDLTDLGPTRNNLLIFVGFLGVLVLLIASLGLPYSAGYLADRYLPPEVGLWGIAAALAVAVIGAIAVLAAAALPRRIASALLGGVAAGAAVPFLTAVAVRIVGAPVQLNPVVALGLTGALLLAGAGLLARAKLVRDLTDDDVTSVSRSVRRLNLVGAVLSLLVAAAAAAAWRLPQLRYNGGADPKLADGYAISAPLSAPFVVGMIVPLIGGVLWLVPTSARAGRAVAVIGWIALVYAVAQSLHLLGTVVASASVPNAGFTAPNWTAGPGLWCGIIGVGLGLATLAVAVAAARGTTDASSSVPDEEPLAQARMFGTVVAVVLTVVTVVALALPVYRTVAGSAATLLVGFQVNAWGVVALAAGMIGAAWAGARAIAVSQAVAYPLTGAAILCVRLIVPAGVSAQDGFQKAAGLYAGYAALAAFVVAALALAYSSRRITMTDLVARRGESRRPDARTVPATSGRVPAKSGRVPVKKGTR